jgi:hypothetical protein
MLETWLSGVFMRSSLLVVWDSPREEVATIDGK